MSRKKPIATDIVTTKPVAVAKKTSPIATSIDVSLRQNPERPAVVTGEVRASVEVDFAAIAVEIAGAIGVFLRNGN